MRPMKYHLWAMMGLAAVWLAVFAPAVMAEAAWVPVKVLEAEKADRLRVVLGGKTMTLNLYGVQCITEPQAMADWLHQYVKAGCEDRNVKAQVVHTAGTSAVWGRVLLESGEELGEQLLALGLAKVDVKASAVPDSFLKAEEKARSQGLGVWNKNFGQSAQTKGAAPSSLGWAGAGLSLCLLALVITLVWHNRRLAGRLEASGRSTGETAKDGAQVSPEAAALREQTACLDQSKKTILELLQDLNSLVGTLVEENAKYSSSMGHHRVAIKNAMTKAGLDEIKRLLLEEIDHIQTVDQEYKERLSQADHRIKEQQEVIARIQVDAYQDFLTHIANRRVFDKRLSEEFARSRRYETTFCMLLLDVDHFKKVNDQYGHLAGDKTLQLVSHMIEQNIRQTDFLARYGGEEFAVILPETVIRDAALVAGKLREAVERATLMHERQRISVTISLGVAQVMAQDENPESMILRVDQALYRAKRTGRNRVELATQ